VGGPQQVRPVARAFARAFSGAGAGDEDVDEMSDGELAEEHRAPRGQRSTGSGMLGSDAVARLCAEVLSRVEKGTWHGLAA